MATINIDDRLIPEGWEATGEYHVPRGTPGNRYEPHLIGNCVYMDDPGEEPYIILRRKPVLIRVVLDVTGPKRKINGGEYYLDSDGSVRQLYSVGPTIGEFYPLSAPVQVTK